MIECNNVKELVEKCSEYHLTIGTLAVICGINKSQMRQYAVGIRNPSSKTIAKINEKIRIFADELKEFQITDA